MDEYQPVVQSLLAGADSHAVHPAHAQHSPMYELPAASMPIVS